MSETFKLLTYRNYHKIDKLENRIKQLDKIRKKEQESIKQRKEIFIKKKACEITRLYNENHALANKAQDMK